MKAIDVQYLVRQLHDLYGEKFPPLAPAMLVRWGDALVSVDPEDMDAAVERWVRQHPPTFAPTLQALLDTVELVEDDRRQARAAYRPVHPQPLAETLAAVATQAPPPLRTWAHLHVQMFVDGLCRPSNYPATAARCRENARLNPDEAQAWEQEAAWYENGCLGRPGTLMV